VVSLPESEPRKRNLLPRKFFDRSEQDRIVNAIAAAEKRTSGEIRLYVEQTLPAVDAGSEPSPDAGTAAAGDVATRRAREVFSALGMHQTAARNGVLIYLATRARRFAVVGDERLHTQVGDEFWQEIVNGLTDRFASGHFTAGLIAAIELIGEKLRAHFPHPPDDRNELPDDIAYGD
jgi:uncharacterized membrane protein